MLSVEVRMGILLFSVYVIGVFGGTLGIRLWTQLDGVVVTSQDIPARGDPRGVTEYTLRGPDGRESRYTAGPLDPLLPRSMLVGTYLKKKRWRVDYERDGGQVNDFSLPLYLAVLTVGFSCLSWSFLLWRRTI
jgi:hypothetical protein